MKKFFINIFTFLMTFVLLFVVGEVSLRIYRLMKDPPDQYFDKKLGWRPTRNYKFKGILKDANQMPYSVEIETNEYGFRLFGDLNSLKKKIMVIGDSFTYDLNVSNDKTYYAIINKRLPVEIFAYSCGGYGTLQEYMILDEYIDIIKPDIIIWQFCAYNDFINNDYELELNSTINNPGYRRPFLSEDGHIYYAIPLRHFKFIREYICPYSRLVSFIMKRMDRLKAFCFKDETIEKDIISQGSEHHGFKRSAMITERLMKMVRERSPNTRILVFCEYDYYPFYDTIKKIVEQNSMEFIDGIPQAIRHSVNQGLTPFGFDNTHWNEEGNRVVAEKIIEYLSTNKIID